MGDAIGQMLPAAVGVAISPFPIIASVLFVGTPRGRVNGPAFVLGCALGTAVVGTFRQWRDRPSAGETAPAPKWMSSLDGFGPPKALGAGVVLTALNPKNLVLTVAGAAAIAQTGIPAGEQAVALAVFVVIGCLGEAAPVAISLAMGDRSRRLLDGLKDWLARNNTVIMVVILTVIGVKLIGDAISGLS